MSDKVDSFEKLRELVGDLLKQVAVAREEIERACEQGTERHLDGIDMCLRGNCPECHRLHHWAEAAGAMQDLSMFFRNRSHLLRRRKAKS